MVQNDESQYSSVQIGWLSIIILGVAIVSIIIIMLTLPYDPVAFIIMFVVLAILVICLIIFSFMSVICDRAYLKIRIGYIISKSFPIKDVESCKVVRIPWYYGWGIRIVPGGWLYRVSGFYAIEINMKNGKRYLIGTNEPQNLAEFINKLLKQNL
ncbi:hypothetical protein DRQ09_07330 [candidate division KSB1 bacterium]|nr:MAG: hypothetical protein DRQ09_07330 [candidate division KSB1 bacterium]